MGHSYLIHAGLKAHLMLCAIMVYLQDLFSRKHRFPFFAKVARISPRYKMQFFGCLPCSDAYGLTRNLKTKLGARLGTPEDYSENSDMLLLSIYTP